MKELKCIAIAVFVFGLGYLVGSFMNASFDLKLWNGEARGFIGFVSAGLSIGSFIFFYEEFKDKE